MIQIQRLSRLHGVALTRKCALMLEGIERELYRREGKPGNPEKAGEAEKAELSAYLRDLAAFLERSPESLPETRAAARSFLDASGASEADGDPSTRPARGPLLRAVNDLRHVLMRVSGQAPADWDLHDYLSPAVPEPGDPRVARRQFLPGLKVYLEDIRSPFNVGTILRTAEALGFEEVLLSPGCADPRHPRAARSSMGAVDMIPWRRLRLEDLPSTETIFALELGGSPLREFSFPKQGILILGSEELGVSSPALSLAGDRRVSIPMRGIKASINVAVAFGIAAQVWVSSL